MATKTKQKKGLAKGMSLACLTVSDLQRAKKFFEEFLGFEITDSNENYNWIEFGNENGSLIGVGSPPPEYQDENCTPGMNAVLSIEVEDINSAKKELEAKGVKFFGEIMEIPGEVKMIMFEDFDKNKFFLTQSLR